MDWDHTGASLAIASEGSSTRTTTSNRLTPSLTGLYLAADVLMWDASAQTTAILETDAKSPVTMLRWSLNGSVLVIGTSKGSVIMYNQQNKRRVGTLCRGWRVLLRG